MEASHMEKWEMLPSNCEGFKAWAFHRELGNQQLEWFGGGERIDEVEGHRNSSLVGREEKTETMVKKKNSEIRLPWNS